MSKPVKCFVCSKETNLVGVDEWGGNGDLWKKFCVLVSRYLDLSSSSALYSQSRVLTTFVNNENICELCAEFVTSFCDSYEEWKNAELRLNWSLKRVAQLMRGSKVNVSRSKPQSKPKCRRSREENVLQFKTDLLVNYDLHSSKEFPRLNLSKLKLDVDDHEQSEETIFPSDVNVKVEIPEFEDFDVKFEPDTEFDPDLSLDHEGSSPTSPSPSPGLQEPDVSTDGSRSNVKPEVEVKPAHDHDEEDKKKSKCRYCGKAFNGRRRAFIHEFQHTGQKPFQCSICSKTFNDPCACIRHLKGIHKEKDKTKMIVEDLEIAKVVLVGAYKDKSTACSICGKEFHTYKRRKRHELRHKRNMSKVNEPLICKFCGREFNHLRYLTKHENVHMRAGPSKLNTSKTPSPKVKKAEVNVEVTELTRNERQANENADLNLEEKQVSSVEVGSKVKDPLPCKYCGKEFQIRRCLRHHEVRHEKGLLKRRGTQVNAENEKVNNETVEDKLNSQSTSTKVRKFQCQHCDKRFHNRRSQNLHELQHTDKMPFQCIICSRKFKDPSHCLRHIKSIHDIGATEDPKSHMWIESEEIKNQLYKRFYSDKSLICTFCGKTFETYQKRRHHEQRYHIKEKMQYQCSTCGKEVASLKNLRRHEILHTGLRPFKCRKGCGRSYKDDSSRKKHEDHGRHLEDGTFVRKISDRAHLRKPGIKYKYRSRLRSKINTGVTATVNSVEVEVEAAMDIKVNDNNQAALLRENENLEFSEQKINLDATGENNLA